MSSLRFFLSVFFFFFSSSFVPSFIHSFIHFRSFFFFFFFFLFFFLFFFFFFCFVSSSSSSNDNSLIFSFFFFLSFFCSLIFFTPDPVRSAEGLYYVSAQDIEALGLMVDAFSLLARGLRAVVNHGSNPLDLTATNADIVIEEIVSIKKMAGG